MINPSASIQAANQAAASIQIRPTNSSLLFTTPTQVISTQGSIKQLPDQVITAMINQQSVNNSSLSDLQKKQNGILQGPVGVTFNQLSSPGQSIKPGAGEFIQSLQQSAPGLNLNQTASKVLMTGTNGVSNPASLLASTAAQTKAVTSSIQNATSGLIKTGTISPATLQQSSGVIFAASTVGVSTVAAALKNPGAVTSAIAGVANSSVGQLVASGNFAAGLADKVSSGVSGLANSISGVANGAVSSLSSGVTGLLDKFKGAAGGVQTGISSLISSLASTSQNAFNVAEASFGTLKAGEPNTLGVQSETEKTTSNINSKFKKLNAAQDELVANFTELKRVNEIYKQDPTDENLQKVKDAKKNVDASLEKCKQAREELATDPDKRIADIFSSSDTPTTTPNLPSPANTGLNALPGGSDLFANQVQAGGQTVLSTAKNVTNLGLIDTSGTVGALGNPAALAGNLVGNVTGALTQGLTGAAQSINSAIGGVTSLGDSLKTQAVGLSSSLLGVLDSIGNAPKIKIPILATGTFAAASTINSKIGECLGDPRVPPPVFEEPPAEDIDADEYLLAQAEAQSKINDYKFDRETLTYRLDSAIEEYNKENDPEILAQIEEWQNQLDVLDTLIIQAQEAYNNIVTYT